MLVHLSFVPPEGGEADYGLSIEMPEIPRAGDYLSIRRSGASGAENFIVKRTWWNLEFDESKSVGSTSEVWVECEFALSPYSSDSHKKACEMYRNRTGLLKEFDDSMY